MERDYDVIVWGASGFTGRLVAEYLYGKYGIDGDLKWAMGGRNLEKLQEVAQKLGIKNVPFITADSHDPKSLAKMVKKTKVICTTVGPYAMYGTELVAACVEHKTDYCDLTGEVQWMRRIIDTYHEKAKAKGVRIVHTCGFDSIPSDMGVYFLQQEAKKRFGDFCESIKFRVRAAKGGLSGGTYASLSNVMVEAEADNSIYEVLNNPYALNPKGERDGPDEPDIQKVEYDEDIKAYIAPFIMATINTKVVRRSNALLDYRYGKDFRYDEAIMSGKGISGRLKGWGGVMAIGAVMAAKPGTVIKKLIDIALPEPGEGPSKRKRESGFYNLLFIGKMEDGTMIRAKVTGDRDPGYGSTSKMLGESAVCLALDEDFSPDEGGILTPSVAMGEALLTRLQSNAGLTFTILS
jgi:short subunit dehydrogenase-like uncharacterized protein